MSTNEPGVIRHSEEEQRAIHEASTWFARMQESRGNKRLRAEWAEWCAADPLHQRAWLRVEEVCRRMGLVPRHYVAATLQPDAGRRAVLRSLGGLVVLGGSGALAHRMLPWQVWQSDYSTRVGERRDLQLPDGSALALNTGSAVDVLFTPERRLLRLHAGEILVQTQADPMGRPFLVETAHGQMRALGTRFTVQLDGAQTLLVVQAHAVEVSPRLGSDAPVRVEAGQQVRFDAQGAGKLAVADASAGSWQQGRLIVVDKPLAEVVAELGRYRNGYLGCDPAVAGLRVSGAFPVDDIEQALAGLADGLPVRVDRFTRYWARVVPK